MRWRWGSMKALSRKGTRPGVHFPVTSQSIRIWLTNRKEGPLLGPGPRIDLLIRRELRESSAILPEVPHPSPLRPRDGTRGARLRLERKFAHREDVLLRHRGFGAVTHVRDEFPEIADRLAARI